MLGVCALNVTAMWDDVEMPEPVTGREEKAKKTPSPVAFSAISDHRINASFTLF